MLLLKQPCRQFFRQCEQFNGTPSREVVQVAVQVQVAVVVQVVVVQVVVQVVVHKQ
jgi:hypothetical protein